MTLTQIYNLMEELLARINSKMANSENFDPEESQLDFLEEIREHMEEGI